MINVERLDTYLLKRRFQTERSRPFVPTKQGRVTEGRVVFKPTWIRSCCFDLDFRVRGWMSFHVRIYVCEQWLI